MHAFHSLNSVEAVRCSVDSKTTYVLNDIEIYCLYFNR